MPDDKQKLYSLRGAAEVVGCSHAYIPKLIKRHKLKMVRINQKRVPQETVDALKEIYSKEK